MEKWLLLVLTAGCAYVTFDSFRSGDAIKRGPFGAISNLWKGDLSHLSAAEQSKVKEHFAGPMGLGQFQWILLVVTIVSGVFCVRAFLA